MLVMCCVCCLLRIPRRLAPPMPARAKAANAVAVAKAEADAALAAAKATKVVATPDNWSAKEQKQLQQGLKLFPNDDPRRWERIADFVSSRTKEECLSK